MRENTKIPIHHNAFVDKDTYINPSAIIGKDVKIEKNVYVSSGAKIYGKIIIKEGTYIGENCIIGHPQRTELSSIVKSASSSLKSRVANTTWWKNAPS